MNSRSSLFGKSSAILSTTLLLLAVWLPASSASATTFTFFGEDLGLGEASVLPSASRINSTGASNSFLGNLIMPGIETFESIAPGSAAPLAINFPGAGVIATLGGTGSVVSQADGITNGVGRYGVTDDVDADERYWASTGGANNLTITFSSPVAAFGFWGIDIGDFNGQVTATTVSGLNQVFNVGNTVGAPGGSVLFWGIIDDALTFSSISLSNTGSGTDLFAYDDFTVGSLKQVGVPEPGTAMLMGLGLGLWLVADASRQRRRG